MDPAATPEPAPAPAPAPTAVVEPEADDPPAGRSARYARLAAEAPEAGVDAPTGRRLALLTLTALGIVYGDIGTSPLIPVHSACAVTIGSQNQNREYVYS